MELIIQDMVHASVNGKITDEDSLRITFEKEKCDLPNMLASFYTTTFPIEEIVIEGKILNTKFFKLSK